MELIEIPEEAAARAEIEERLAALERRYAACQPASAGNPHATPVLMIARRHMQTAVSTLNGAFDRGAVLTLACPTIEAWRISKAHVLLKEANRWMAETERRAGLAERVSARSLLAGDLIRDPEGNVLDVVSDPRPVTDLFGDEHVTITTSEPGSDVVGTMTTDPDQFVDRVLVAAERAA